MLKKKSDKCLGSVDFIGGGDEGEFICTFFIGIWRCGGSLQFHNIWVVQMGESLR